VQFFSATFGAGVNATHCPITRPKRRKQPERYAPFFEIVGKIIDKNKEIGKIIPGNIMNIIIYFILTILTLLFF
jgi:hypothetical protein